MSAAERANALDPQLPEVQVAQAWILYSTNRHDQAVDRVRHAILRKPDCEGAYYLLCRALFASGRYQETADIAEVAIEASGGDDYNVYIPIENALGALGKEDTLRTIRQRRMMAIEKHLRQVPEDARSRALLAGDYAVMDRVEDALREANLAIALRPNDAMILYNVACVFGMMKRKDEAMDTLRKAWDAGFRDSDWARRDPDLSVLHEEPEFKTLYPSQASPE
jgi:tetratricopeptide (TPR) repeat protein